MRALLAVAALISIWSGAATAHDVVWTPCDFSLAFNTSFECATLPVPRCYDGDACFSGGDAFSLPMVRLAAPQPEAAPLTIWWLSDQRDLSSLVPDMINLRASQNASVYVIQRRGIDATSPTTPGTMAECAALRNPRLLHERHVTTAMLVAVSACRHALTGVYGSINGLATFSSWNAAQDLATAITTVGVNAGSHRPVVVFARARETLVARRLMQLASVQPRIAGYILEGVRPPRVRAQEDGFKQVADAFLAACTQDKDNHCGETLSKPSDTLQSIYKSLDARDREGSACLKLLRHRLTDDDDDGTRASFALRSFLGEMLQNATLAPMIPALMYHIDRCKEKDEKAITIFLKATTTARSAWSTVSLLDLMVDFSERWDPLPTESTLEDQWERTLLGGGTQRQYLAAYCAFSGDTNVTCSALYTADANATRAAGIASWLVYANVSTSQSGEPLAANLLLLASRVDPLSPPLFVDAFYTQQPKSRNATQLVLFSDAVASTQHFGGHSLHSNRTNRVVALFIQAATNSSSGGLDGLVGLVGQWHVDQVDKLLQSSSPGDAYPPSSHLAESLAVDFAVGATTSRAFFGSNDPFGDDAGPLLQPLLDALELGKSLFRRHFWASVGVSAAAALLFCACCVCCCRGWCRRHTKELRELRRSRKTRERQAAEQAEQEEGEDDPEMAASPLSWRPLATHVDPTGHRHVTFDMNAPPPRVAARRRRRFFNRLLWYENVFTNSQERQRQLQLLAKPSRPHAVV